MTVSIVCECGAVLHTITNHDRIQCDDCGAIITIDINRFTDPDDATAEIPQPQFRAPIRAAVDEIRDELDDVLGIVLYGSVARGEADRRSDIDLWVLVEDDRLTAQREANRSREELEGETWNGERYHFEIDVETQAAVENYEDDIQKILSEGIVLYDTEDFEHRTPR